MDIKQKIDIARQFGEQVQELSTTNFRRLLDSIKSMDFADAVQERGYVTSKLSALGFDAYGMMAEAFRRVIGREPVLIDDEIDSDNEAWGDAFSIAVAADFFC
jgi:hypothetical protein